MHRHQNEGQIRNVKVANTSFKNAATITQLWTTTEIKQMQSRRYWGWLLLCVEMWRCISLVDVTEWCGGCICAFHECVEWKVLEHKTPCSSGRTWSYIVPRVRHVVAGLPVVNPRGSNPCQMMEFVVDKVALGQYFSEYYGLHCQFSFYQMLRTIDQLVTEVQRELRLTTLHHLTSGTIGVGIISACA
jgi:hypothetical protein